MIHVRYSSRAAITLIEILAVVAIIGVLIGMLLPAVAKVRGTVERLECANNLKQQGLALHAYHDAEGMLPPSRINPGTGWYRGGPQYDYYGSSTYQILGHTAFTLLLPYLEQQLGSQFDFHAPSSPAYYQNWGPALVNGGVVPPGNVDVISRYVRTYHCPADAMPECDTIGAVTTQTGGVNWENSCTSARRSNYLLNIYHEWYEFVSPYVVDPKSDNIAMLVVHYNFGGQIPYVRGMFMDNARFRLEDTLDGSSNTIAIGETKQQHWQPTMNFSLPNPHWGSGERNSVAGSMKKQYGQFPGSLHINFPMGTAYPNLCPLGTRDPKYFLQDAQGFGSWHSGGANFLFADGSIRFLTNRTSFAVFDAMGTANGNEALMLHAD